MGEFNAKLGSKIEEADTALGTFGFAESNHK